MQQLKTDVNDFYNKIKKYLAIVEKTLRDMIPKAIKLYIIDQLKEYIRDEMPPALYDSSQVNLVSTEADDSMTPTPSNTYLIS